MSMPPSDTAPLSFRTAMSIAGLPRREEGQTLIVADSTGKEIPIPKAQIKRQVPSNLSLMPSNFGEILKPDEFNDLMSYLLKHRRKVSRQIKQVGAAADRVNRSRVAKSFPN